MKITIDARPLVDPARGGVSRVSAELVEAYATQFPDDEIICVTTGIHKPTLPARIAAHTNVTHRHISIPNKVWSALCFFNIVSFPADLFLNIGFIGRKKGVLLLHDLSFLIEPKWFTLKQRLWHWAVRATTQIKHASHLLAVSETTKQDAIRLLGIPAEKITVIPVGATLVVARDEYRAGTRPAPTKPYILTIGGNDPRKNTKTAIEAAKKIGIEIVVVGAPLAGAPTDSELTSLYANASAFLYPSWYEGYGLPLHEAAQFGIPCIASSTGALPETAPPGTLFANPAKPHQWIEALKIALSKPKPDPISPNPDAWKQAAEILKKALDH